jgi:hypothetical protein
MDDERCRRCGGRAERGMAYGGPWRGREIIACVRCGLSVPVDGDTTWAALPLSGESWSVSLPDGRIVTSRDLRRPPEGAGEEP